MTRRFDRAFQLGLGITVVSFVIFWFCARDFDAGRGDFFYLADAFLHGRTYLPFQPGPFDVIIVNGRYYVPFAPFPAIALMPLVAVLGAVTADQVESGINAALAAAGVGLAWWMLGRMGVKRLSSRFWLTVLYGFSTQVIWITTRGGVWHTGQLIATILTFAALIELWGGRRAWLIGLLAGAAFLTRAPLALAIPFYALLLMPSVREIPWRRWTGLALGIVPSVAFFLFYNQVRFGSPFESGYGLALLPDWLEAQRKLGLFGLVHLKMNLDYFLFHFTTIVPEFPWFRPDGLGLSVLITSPGLLYAFRADWRDRRAWWLAGAALLVLIPSLLYYGGGWLQYGYRYFQDSVPFVIALCGSAAAMRGTIGLGWRALIVFGVIVMAAGAYWAHVI